MNLADHPFVCDDIASAPGCESGFHGFPSVASAQDGVEGALDILTIGEVAECFAYNEALVPCARLSELLKQAIGLVVEDNLHFPGHQDPPYS